MRERSALFERIEIVKRTVIIPRAWRRCGCASVYASINDIRVASIIDIGIGIGKGIGKGIARGGRGHSRRGGSNGRPTRIDTSRAAGCVAATSGTSTTAKVLARALHSCFVRASWVGGGSIAIQNYVYWAHSPEMVVQV